MCRRHRQGDTRLAKAACTNSRPYILQMSSFATMIRAMGERGESAYAEVDGEYVVDVPAQACKGRVGDTGKTFSGYLDLRNGYMRFDCAEEFSFYLNVDLSQIPALAAQPSAPDGLAAVSRTSDAASLDAIQRKDGESSNETITDREDRRTESCVKKRKTDT